MKDSCYYQYLEAQFDRKEMGKMIFQVNIQLQRQAKLVHVVRKFSIKHGSC